jgi:hypothetical protein
MVWCGVMWKGRDVRLIWNVSIIPKADHTHRVTSHHITSHHSHHITHHSTSWLDITWHHLTHLTPLDSTSFCIIHIASYHFTPHQTAFFRKSPWTIFSDSKKLESELIFFSSPNSHFSWVNFLCALQLGVSGYKVWFSWHVQYTCLLANQCVTKYAFRLLGR